MTAFTRPAAGMLALLIAVSLMSQSAFGSGEDIGQPGSENTLREIGRQMRSVQQRISDQDTSKPTQKLQQQVVDDLNELIRQMEKKCSGGQCQGQKPSSSPPKKPSKGPAKDSVSQLNQQATQSTIFETARQLNQKAWGHLPPVLREGVLNADFERFLPKYERLIERYFSRLAEESNDLP